MVIYAAGRQQGDSFESLVIQMANVHIFIRLYNFHILNNSTF